MVENIFEREAEPGKYFYCENGRAFKSIRELQNALLNTSADECNRLFIKHTSGYKNDFSAWIGDVFNLRDLAEIILPIKAPREFSKALDNYEIESNKKNSKEGSPIIKEEKKSAGQDAPQSIENLKGQISERLDRSDQQFDRVKKIKQHSFYNKADFEDSVESLKNRYEEINHSISEHRKEGKDMSIPYMMLRNVLPKITYFQVSQNRTDYDKIIEDLEDIEKEINYEKNVKHGDLKEEIMEALGIFRNKKED